MNERAFKGPEVINCGQDTHKFKDSPLGMIPEEWGVKRLGDRMVSELITDGSHFSPSPLDDSEYMIATIENIKNGKIEVSSCKKISKKVYENLIKNNCIPKTNDVLFTKDGTIGIALKFSQKEKIALLSSIAIIRAKYCVLTSDFLVQYLKSSFISKQLEVLSGGSALRRVVLRDIRDFWVLLPPLPEQQKIAEILETVDSAIEKTAAIIEKYKRLKRGLMQELLTKGIDENGKIRSEKTHKFKDSPLGRIPGEWEIKRLGDMGAIESGSTPSTRIIEYWDGNIVWLTPEDLSKTENLLISDSLRKISLKGLKHSSAKLIPAYSVVISSRAPIGYVKVCKTEFSTNQGCKSIVKNDLFNPLFLAYLLIEQVQKMKNLGSGTTFQEISKSSLEKLLLPLPPLPEQQRIAEVLSQVDSVIKKEQAYKEKLERIKRGLMKDLLTGRFRVNGLINSGNMRNN